MAPARISPPITGGELIQKSTRRPTLVRKLAEADLGDVQRPQTPSSPIKRAKVAFNDEVEINVVDEWNRAPELIREEVRRALERHRDGDDKQYDKVKQVFIVDPMTGSVADSGTLRVYTAALLSNVPLLTRSCSDLIQLVLQSGWLRRDDSYVQLYQRFLGNLILTQSIWLNPTLHMLVDNFLQKSTNTSATANLSPITPRQIRFRVHGCLKSLLRLLPTASQNLSQILNNRFPHIHESKRTHIRYVHNLLRIIEYAPELRSEISALITDRIVKVDVQVQVDYEDLEDDSRDDVDQAITQSTEDFVDETDEESSDESDLESEAMDNDEQRIKEIKANSDKLDLLLDTMFEYYQNLFDNPVTQEAALDTLVSHFNTTILPTYQSRHTQFLLFHFAQTSPILIDIFIGILIRTAFDNTRAHLIRQTAASYLASFVARGNHVPAATVREIFDYISGQLLQMRSQYLPGFRGPDPRRYGTYYALCQALFYIFCFRWRDLRVSAEDDITPSPSSMLYPAGAMEEDDFEAPVFPSIIKETLLIHCFKGLNPLKVCAPAIVAEFARISHRLGIIYIYPYLESNKRVRIINNTPIDHRETALTNLRGDEWQAGGLDAYFPFDPYKLPRSKRWLEGDYREWQPLPGGEDVEADDISESEGEEDIEDSETEGTATDEEEE